MIRVPRRGPKGLEFRAEAVGRIVFGGRQCPKCHMRKFTLTGKQKLFATRSGGRSFRRIEVQCMACEHVWWSQNARVLALAAR